MLILFLLSFPFYCLQDASAQSVAEANDFYISKGEIELLGYHIIVSTELTESGFAANSLQQVEINNGQLVYIFVNWYNLPVREHVIEYVLYDGDNNFILRDEKIESPQFHRWYNSFKIPFYRHLVSNNNISIRISIDDYLLAEKEITLSFIGQE